VAPRRRSDLDDRDLDNRDHDDRDAQATVICGVATGALCVPVT
jgi:hypothetical protein